MLSDHGPTLAKAHLGGRSRLDKTGVLDDMKYAICYDD